MVERIRIQKFLSNNKILSRRKAEEYLLKGLIKVNNTIITEPGFKVDPLIDKVEVLFKENFTYLAYYKPRGIVTNCAQQTEKEIKDLLPLRYQNLHAVGRLDKDSEGLILLSDDGVFANRFLNSDLKHDREYLVWVDKLITDEMIEKLKKGVIILGDKTLPCSIYKEENNQIKIILQEGKNRQIRRMLEQVGLKVIRLKRIRIADIKINNLQECEYRVLTQQEKDSLL